MKKMKQRNKKGQVMQNLGLLAVGIAALVIILAVTFLVMAQIKTQAVTQGIDTVYFDNATIAGWTNNTGFSLGGTCMGMSNCTLYNDTAQTVAVPNASYSCAMSGDTQPQVTVLNFSGENLAGTVYLDWTCVSRSNAFNSTLDLTNATATIPGWIPLIILVIIGGVILGLVSAFKRR